MTTRRSLTAITVIAAVASVVPVVAGVAETAAGGDDTFIITNKSDDGSPSSLRAAIDTVNMEGGNWTIQLQPGASYVINRKCGHGDLDDNHGGDLDLKSGAKVTFASTSNSTQATIEVKCVGERVFDHTGGGELRFRRIVLTGGNTANGALGSQGGGDPNGHDAGSGGAVRSDGDVVLDHSRVAGNSTGSGGSGAPPLLANGPGGYGGHGGGGGAIIANSIDASNSEFVDNVTGNGGTGGNGLGAGFSGGSGGGAGNGTLAAFTIDLYRVRIGHNTLGTGGRGGAGVSGAVGGAGGPGGSGAALYTTTVQVDASTIDANVAGTGGAGGNATTKGGTGAGGGLGGGIVADLGTIRRSTVHGNAAGTGGAGGTGAMPGTAGGPGSGGGVRVSPGPGIAIDFSTITANSAGAAANLDVPVGSIVLASVVGDPQGGGANCANLITTGGYNVYDSASCGVGPRDVTMVPVPLGPLTDNGGSTPTRMPLPGSALISSIPHDLCAAFDVVVESGYDQRGQLRPSSDCEPGSVEVPVGTATKFVPLPPARVFDTREPGPASGYVQPGTTRTVTFAGVAGIPATGATAVAFNLTIDAAGGAGFVTASPTGRPRPLASNINVERAGQTAPNFVVVPLGAGGQVDFFVQSGGHLIADVIGYFTPAQVAAAGRIISVVPQRVFDTREPGSLHGKVPAGGTITVPIPQASAGVLVADGGPVAVEGSTFISAVVLNVTATEADDAGYVTVYPGDVDRPLASTLNLDGPGHTVANLTIVPLGEDGTIRLYSQSGAHLLADLVGLVTGDATDLSTRGLIVPLDPVRVFDTRDSGAPIPAGGMIDVPTAGQVGIPADAAGVLLNVTATEAADAGYVAGWPTGLPQPLASTVNLTHAGETRANGALLIVGDDGVISYFSQSGTHLLADAFGYLLKGEMPLV